MVTNRVDINSLLNQMRDLKAQSASTEQIRPRSDVEAALVGETKSVNKAPEFSEMFSNAINSVNDTQKTAGALSKAYEQGDASVSLSQVMVASQKASVSFQALTQVRNKLVEAYQDVMNMPI
jgi:flagellar hook-basal body complex protein FliE